MDRKIIEFEFNKVNLPFNIIKKTMMINLYKFG